MFRNILYKYTYMYITTVNEKGDHELEGEKEGVYGRSRKGEWKGEMM